ncbi:Hypothetical predicted protein [Scomber scombrus]|uniref:Uncharacterized protein n=1 Tax=Scomber scombrus TaxID=13677 RepID=A0AAV1P0Q3_SCOSC
MEDRHGGQGLKKNIKEGEKPGASGGAKVAKEMWMINDASVNWMKKYRRCPVCTAEETQRQRYTLLMLTLGQEVRADSKATVLRSSLPQPSSSSFRRIVVSLSQLTSICL